MQLIHGHLNTDYRTAIFRKMKIQGTLKWFPDQLDLKTGAVKNRDDSLLQFLKRKKKGLEYDELHPWLLPFRTYFSCPFNDQMPSLHYDVYYVYFLRVVHNKMIGVKWIYVSYFDIYTPNGNARRRPFNNYSHCRSLL